MTIQAILKCAVTLLGADEGAPRVLPVRNKLITALDSALAELARCFPLQARCRITVTDGEALLPNTVLTPRSLLKNGKRVPLHIFDGMLRAEDGDYTLIYYRIPPVASEQKETDTLPYPEDILRALPFYCAAMCVMGEDNHLYSQLMEQYNTKLAAALGYRPAAGVEGGGSL